MSNAIRVAVPQSQSGNPHHTSHDVLGAAVLVVVQKRVEVPIASFQHQVHVRRALDHVIQPDDRRVREALQGPNFRIYSLNVALRLVQGRVALDPFLSYRFAGELPGAVLALDTFKNLRELALACAKKGEIVLMM